MVSKIIRRGRGKKTGVFEEYDQRKQEYEVVRSIINHLQSIRTLHIQDDVYWDYGIRVFWFIFRHFG